jgi:hypothetical protein
MLRVQRRRWEQWDGVNEAVVEAGVSTAAGKAEGMAKEKVMFE